MDGYVFAAFVIMGLLFVRHIFIYKQQFKINYASLIVAVGAISSLVHFIMHPEIKDVVLLIRESLFPLLISLLMYLVMNLLHQSQSSQQSKELHNSTNEIMNQIEELKNFAVELERKILLNKEISLHGQKELQEKLNQDIKSLEAIQINQGKFLEKFDDLSSWHKDISDVFKNFINVELPQLDNVVHKHIDMLRVAEQDHFNKIRSILESSLDERIDVSGDMEELKKSFESMKSISNTIADSIKQNTMQQLSSVTKAFEGQMITLKSHAEGITTSLYEGENKVKSIKDKSEMVISQISLASDGMHTIESQSIKLHEAFSKMQELIDEVDSIKSDYIKAQSELTMLAKEVKNSDQELVLNMKEKIEDLGNELREKIEKSLDKLNEHYHIASKDISKSVEILSKRTKLKGYEDL